ncbi:hypothetical protein KDA23_02370, partial [Candidatus Saccharibacteria bacterium]|nr:hypothetical protein [Candidatus Saccharibacteria bacterium]
MALLIVSTLFVDTFNIWQQQTSYELSSAAKSIIPNPSAARAISLKYDQSTGSYEYNQNYRPATDTAGTAPGPKFSASVPADINGKGIEVTDAVNNVSMTIQQDFSTRPARQNQNQLIYPIVGRNAQKVYTFGGNAVKEDIVLNESPGDTFELNYELKLPAGTEARLETNGDVAIYGVNPTILGNVTTSSEKDAELLQKARQNGQKNTLVFTLPAPLVLEYGKRVSDIKAWFTLHENQITVHAKGLASANYPLTIDPSVYIETASKLMRGNNETNTDFDVTNELIQKSQTTGARIDDWSSTSNLSSAIWQQGTAVAGGYIYTVGGSDGATTVSTPYMTAGSYGSGTGGFPVPAGVTSVTVKVWGAGGGAGAGNNQSGSGGDGGGGGYAKSVLTVTPGETLNVVVGTGGAGAGGNRRGGSGGGFSAVLRSSTYLIQAGGGGGGGGAEGTSRGNGGNGGAGGGSNGVSGSNGGNSNSGGGGVRGTNSGGGNGGSAGNNGASGANGAANAGGDGGGSTGTCNASVSGNTGGAGGYGGGGLGGNDSSSCEGGGGGGGGRYGGGGGGSVNSNNRGAGGGGGGSDLVTGTSQVETAGLGTTPGNSGDSDRSGAGDGAAGSSSTTGASGADGGVIISYTLAGTGTTNKVSWAHFNSSNRAIESPNPGAGACTGWCSKSDYNLPTSLKGLSLIAYDGYLYAIGGSTSAGTPQTTVYIAKLGANGEPQLWHPTNTNKSSWTYWYSDTALSNARSYFGAVAYNNTIYILGGLTTSSTVLSSNTVQSATIRPNGTLTSWTTTGMQALSPARYGLTAQVYNDTLYVLGGNATFNGTPVSTVEYSKLNTDGTMNSWTATSSMITSGRQSMGGSFSTIFGGYVYIAGGCTAVDTNGYCTGIATDVQLASINADGSLSEWNTILGLDINRMGHTLIAWQGGLYRLGGCRAQDTGTGLCTNTVLDVDYGVINPEGEASTVADSVSSGTAPCSGATPYNCELPGPTTTTPVIGNVLTGSALMNGYLYIWGGCDNATGSGCGSVSRGVIYTSVGSDGSLTKPASCGSWTALDSYCYNSTSLPSGGAGAPGTATFNGYIYSVGGFTSGGSVNSIYYASPSLTDGSISSWSTVGLSGGGSVGATNVSYPYAFTRANPVSAGSVPGNLYILGGCSGPSGIGCSNYTGNVYKCNIGTTGVPSSCSTSNQLQIGAVTDGLGHSAGTGLGAMAGTLYANYIYLMGGLSSDGTYGLDLKVTRYAKIDNSNNIVAVSGSTWVESPSLTYYGRRRGAGFGYNGYLYVVGGYEGGGGGGGILADIEFAKIDVSDGSIGAWSVSSVNIQQRWGLGLIVSNSYAYVIGGCINGNAPTCSSGGWTNSIQEFQIYNNDSGAIKQYTAGNTTGVDRIGGSSTIMNGYIYYAGGCTNIGCTAFTKTTYYAPIDAYGTVGTWSAGGTMPGGGGVAWGKLLNSGGTLYYVGGQTGSATTTAQSTVYYSSGISSGNPTWGTSGTGITNTSGTSQPRTQFGAAVWNSRIYVVGGYSSGGTVQSTVFVSPQLTTANTGISSNWSSGSTSFNVARAGLAVVAYANNLYLFGGYDGTNYLSDSQFSQINSTTGDVGSWTYSTSLPSRVRDADVFAANGYVYVVGGRSAASTCRPSTLFAPISANTTIATGNNPTGVGDWSETNQKYTGDRYGAAAVYSKGRAYVMGGGCSAFVSSGDRMYYSTIKSQPQVAKYSRMIDADGNVFPTKWLLNGVDNSIGAHWQANYRSAPDAFFTDRHSGFDNGSNGAQVTENDITAFDNCYQTSPGTNVYSNAQYITPPLSMRLDSNADGAGACSTQ